MKTVKNAITTAYINILFSKSKKPLILSPYTNKTMHDNNDIVIEIISTHENVFLIPDSPSLKYAILIYPSDDKAMKYPNTITTVENKLRYPYSSGAI